MPLLHESTWDFLLIFKMFKFVFKLDVITNKPYDTCIPDHSRVADYIDLNDLKHYLDKTMWVKVR